VISWRHQEEEHGATFDLGHYAQAVSMRAPPCRDHGKESSTRTSRVARAGSSTAGLLGQPSPRRAASHGVASRLMVCEVSRNRRADSS